MICSCPKIQRADRRQNGRLAYCRNRSPIRTQPEARSWVQPLEQESARPSEQHQGMQGQVRLSALQAVCSSAARLVQMRAGTRPGKPSGATTPPICNACIHTATRSLIPDRDTIAGGRSSYLLLLRSTNMSLRTIAPSIRRRTHRRRERPFLDAAGDEPMEIACLPSNQKAWFVPRVRFALR